MCIMPLPVSYHNVAVTGIILESKHVAQEIKAHSVNPSTQRSLFSMNGSQLFVSHESPMKAAQR